jgi:hypothetical protein
MGDSQPPHRRSDEHLPPSTAVSSLNEACVAVRSEGDVRDERRGQNTETESNVQGLHPSNLGPLGFLS